MTTRGVGGYICTGMIVGLTHCSRGHFIPFPPRGSLILTSSGHQPLCPAVMTVLMTCRPATYTVTGLVTCTWNRRKVMCYVKSKIANSRAQVKSERYSVA